MVSLWHARTLTQCTSIYSPSLVPSTPRWLLSSQTVPLGTLWIKIYLGHVVQNTLILHIQFIYLLCFMNKWIGWIYKNSQGSILQLDRSWGDTVMWSVSASTNFTEVMALCEQGVAVEAPPLIGHGPSHRWRNSHSGYYDDLVPCSLSGCG